MFSLRKVCLMNFIYISIDFYKVLVFIELTFTLIDFIQYLKTPFFTHFDILNYLIEQIRIDNFESYTTACGDQNMNKPSAKKENCEKSINLIVKIHQLLVDSYSTQQKSHSNRSVLLVWLFEKTLKFYLRTLDYLLKERVFIDTKAEFGFQHNKDVQIQDANYWTDGFKFLFKNLSYIQNFPRFMRILLISSFKLCKYIQIIGLFNQKTSELNLDSGLCENFQKRFDNLFTFSHKNMNQEEISTTKLDTASKIEYQNLLELNFKRIKMNLKEFENHKNDEIEIETLFNATLDDENLYKLNVEFEIDEFIASSLDKKVNLISNILIKNLINNYYLFNFIENLHSYALFKTNELMFLFSKNLFELIKIYESYQDEIILNKILYHSSSSLNTVTVNSSSIMNKLMNYQKLFKIVYENDAKVCQIINQKSPSKQRVGISTRLVSGIKLKFYLNWPYNLIVKEEDVEIYNKFFILILQMKQTKYDLDSLDFKGIETSHISFRYLI